MLPDKFKRILQDSYKNQQDLNSYVEHYHGQLLREKDVNFHDLNFEVNALDLARALSLNPSQWDIVWSLTFPGCSTFQERLSFLVDAIRLMDNDQAIPLFSTSFCKIWPKVQESLNLKDAVQLLENILRLQTSNSSQALREVINVVFNHICSQLQENVEKDEELFKRLLAVMYFLPADENRSWLLKRLQTVLTG